MTTHRPHTTPSSPTIPSPSRSEKLLRDALLRDERERRHRSSTPPPIEAPSHRRRHTHTPTSSYSASINEGSSFHSDISGYCASQSSFDAVSAPPHSPPHSPLHSPPQFSVHHLGQQSVPNSPSPSTKHFNARKASSQCRAIEGYVSFASVEGLGEPPLVGEEFDADGRGNGKDEDERMRAVAFLPMGVLSAALRWKKFVGGTGHGIGHGIEGKDQGVVV